MLTRSWFATMLLGAIGLPYIWFSIVGSGKSAKTAAASSSDATWSIPSTDTDASHAVAGTAVLDKTPTRHDLAEIFRWDVTTAWILARWPRVSAGLSTVEQQGYRVPLVTGTAADDLAGSLTYYFDRRQQVERITFLGTTGDSRRLVALLATKFGFVRELNDDPSLFLYRVRDGRKVISELRIKPAHVVRADAPNTRFEVALLIERPSGS